MRRKVHQYLAAYFFSLGILLSLLFLANQTAVAESSINIDYDGMPQKVLYDLYIPPQDNRKSYPVLVCVGGLPIINDEYVHSSTQECMDATWKKFAHDHHLSILGLGFLFVPEHWPTKSSYQYPQAWSGRALLEILEILKQKFPINADELYLFGISAGAQYSIRMAQIYPRRVKAVAAHAAGGYDAPQEYIPVKFFITVGRNDNAPVSRREFAELFFQQCRAKGIDIRERIIPHLGHRQTGQQNKMSRDFFARILFQAK